MGYFAALAPNTALAKSPLDFNVHRGFAYWQNFSNSYLVSVYLIAIVIVCGLLFRKPGLLKQRQIVVVMPLSLAIAYAGYVILIGGDYMHGRLFVPAVIAGVLPFTVVPMTRQTASVGVSAAVWSIFIIGAVRPPVISTGASGIEITDERQFWHMSGGAGPHVTMNDNKNLAGPVLARLVQGEANEGDTVYAELSQDSTRFDPKLWIRPSGSMPRSTVVDESIGMLGYGLDPDIRVADQMSLADAIGSRMPENPTARPGHQKLESIDWFRARYAPDSDQTPDSLAAKRALGCGELKTLVDATTEPMSVNRFEKNVFDASNLWRLRIPKSPVDAENKFCP